MIRRHLVSWAKCDDILLHTGLRHQEGNRHSSIRAGQGISSMKENLCSPHISLEIFQQELPVAAL